MGPWLEVSFLIGPLGVAYAGYDGEGIVCCEGSVPVDDEAEGYGGGGHRGGGEPGTRTGYGRPTGERGFTMKVSHQIKTHVPVVHCRVQF